MRQRLKTLIATTCLCIAAAMPSLAHALTAADEQELRSFTLTEDFLKRFTKASAEGKAQHIEEDQADPDKAAAMMASLDTLSAELGKNPARRAILEQNGLTPRQAAVGALVLMRTTMTDAMQADPKMAEHVDPSKQPSAANMAFYRAHKVEIQQVLNDDE